MKARKATCCFILLIAALPVTSQTGPISLDRFGREKPLYVLDESGRIFVADQRQSDVPARFVLQVTSLYKALDIVSSKLWVSRELLFVTAYGLTTDDARARVIQYSADGQQQCEWILPEVSVGLDVDPQNHILYLTGSWTGTVYRLKLLKDTCYGPNQLNAVSQVQGAQRLGAIVVDTERQLAFIADILKGSMYKLDLGRGEVVEIARALGQPVALAYNSVQNEVISVDAAGRQILRINVDALPVPKPIVISRDPLFKEPSCVALASDGRILLGDRQAKVIFTVDWSGRIVSQSSMPIAGQR